MRHNVLWLRKNLEYLKIQESWKSEYYLCIYVKEYFYMFFSKESAKAQNKINH